MGSIPLLPSVLCVSICNWLFRSHCPGGADLTEGEPARQRYLAFLGSGGSDCPIELLKSAGVDMTSPQPITSAMQVFGELLAELEELSKEHLNS